MSQVKSYVVACSRMTGVLGFGLAIDHNWIAAALLGVIACTFNPTLGSMLKLTIACGIGIASSVFAGEANVIIGCSLVGLAITITTAIKAAEFATSVSSDSEDLSDPLDTVEKHCPNVQQIKAPSIGDLLF